MKRIILFVIIMAMFSGIYAHEVTANLSLVDDGKMGLKFVRGDLWWGDGSYLLDLDFYYTNNQPIDFHISQVWKKVNLWDLGYLSIGKQCYSFGRVLSSRASKNMQIQRVHVAPLGWMFKFHKEMGKVNLYLDGVWENGSNADLNGRLAYESENFTLGGAVTLGDLGEYFSDTDDPELSIAYEGDIDFVLANFLRLSAQVTNWMGSDEMNYYFVASYAPGFEFPYLGKRIGRVIYGEWRPYVGMITRDDAAGDGMGESNIFGGLNYQSFENSYMKFEVNIDSDDNIDPTFLLQMGYKF